jgi:hypothetical protein
MVNHQNTLRNTASRPPPPPKHALKILPHTTTNNLSGLARPLLYAVEAERERKSIILLQGSQATPARPSGRNNVKVKTLL